MEPPSFPSSSFYIYTAIKHTHPTCDRPNPLFFLLLLLSPLNHVKKGFGEGDSAQEKKETKGLMRNRFFSFLLLLALLRFKLH